MSKKNPAKMIKSEGGQRSLSPDEKKELINTVETFVALYPVDSDSVVADKVINYLHVKERVSKVNVRRKVREARSNLGKNLPEVIIEAEVDKFIKTVLFTEAQLLEILTSPLAKDGNRVQAAAQVVKGRKMIFEVMMDTGVIPRQLGTMNQKHAFLGALALTGDGRKDLDALRSAVSGALVDAGIIGPDGQLRTTSVTADGEEEHEQSD